MSATRSVPDGMVVTRCALSVSTLRRCTSIAKQQGDLPVHSMTDIVERLYAHHGVAVGERAGRLCTSPATTSWCSSFQVVEIEASIVCPGGGW